ncbi:unnamed protein product [Rotaria magnacalcarata]
MNSGQDEMLFLCTVSECNSESCALCRCCEENYCLQYLIEQPGSRKRVLNCLNDEINKLDQQIKILNIQPIIESYRRKSIINDVRIEIDYVKEIYDQVHIDPLPIDDNLISTNKPNSVKLNPSSLSIIDIAINHPQGSYGASAGNEKFLLLHVTRNLILMDQRMNTIQQIEWPYGAISSICWSSTKKRFVVIGKSNIYLVDDQNMSIESLRMIEKRK